MTVNMNQLGTLEHHYQDPENPFGYMFAGLSDEPAPAPDAPAAGEPLLNDFELDSTNQFFDAFKNDHAFLDDSKLMDSLGAFRNEPLPSFHGVSSSYGHPAPHSQSPTHNFDFSSFGTDLSSRFGQTQLASPTAMSHMTHSSHGSLDLSDFGRYPNELPFSPFPVGRKSDARHNSDAFESRTAYAPRPAAISRSSHARQSAPTLHQDSLAYGDHAYPPSRSASARHAFRGSENGVGEQDRGSEAGYALVFGSDSDFRNQNYIAPGANLEDIKGAEMKIQSTLRMFAASESTAPPSPALNTKRRLSTNAAEGFDPLGRRDRLSDSSHVSTNDKRQRKLRLEDGDDEDDYDSADAIPRSAGPFRTSSKRRRPTGKPRTSSDGAGSQPGRRRSQAADQKLPRQNLTEEEKKQNHIKSEQKRRNQIKDGFSSLVEMMPNAASAGSSKCAILAQAVDWMTGLIEGNEKLRAQLDSLVS